MDGYRNPGPSGAWAYGPRRRRGSGRTRWSAVAATTAFFLVVFSSAALAAVWTDQQDYAPGSVVTISGDNSNGAGYLPGETVVVNVSGPNGYEASCEAVADENGAWSCQVTLWDSDLAVGEYTYTATGQTSGVTETGTFTDAGNLTYWPGSVTLNVSPGESTSFSQSVTAPKNNGSFTAKLKVAGTLSNPIPSMWVTASPTQLSFSTDSGSDTKSWTVTFSPPTDAACGTYTANIKADPGTSGVGEGSGTAVTLNVTGCTPSNTPPTVQAGGPYTGTEGSAVTLSGASVTDPDVGDSVTTTWSYAIVSADQGTTCSFGNASVVNTTITCTDDGTFTLTLTAEDGVNPAVTDTASLTLENAAPDISSGSFGSSNASCGTDNVSLSVTFTDDGSNDTHKAEIDWNNDGTYDQTVDSYKTGDPITHTYSTAGLHTAAVKITDDDGGSDTESATVWVNYNTTGILPPITGTQGGATPIFKSKSTIPIKVVLQDCDGSYPSNLAPTIRIRKYLNGTPDGDELGVVSTSAADTGTTMRFDPSGNQYIYNLAASSLSDPTAGYDVTIHVGPSPGGQDIGPAPFGLKK